MGLIAFETIIQSLLENNETELFFRKICELYKVKNLTYCTVDPHSLHTGSYKVFSTYSEDWKKTYVENRFFIRDPIIKFGINSNIVFSWNSENVKKHDVENILGKSKKFDVGDHGFTIPILNRVGVRALFSVTLDGTQKDSQKFKENYLRDFIKLGYFIHKKYSNDKEEKRPKLTPKETEILELMACGKTYKEAADILGIQASTIKYHLEQARFKLNTTNTTHTILTAARLELINLSALL